MEDMDVLVSSAKQTLIVNPESPNVDYYAYCKESPKQITPVNC